MSLSGFISSLDHPPHSSWSSFLSQENQQLLAQIENSISNSRKEFTPPAPFILRFLQMPLENIRIIILGQDPYPQKGVATGRAFEVGTLKNWSDTFSNVSLKNIVRAVYKAYHGEYLKYSQIVKKIPAEFTILPPNQVFRSWEKQGVLLLNTSFTVETGNPGSHASAWEPFTDRLLRFIASSNNEITWFIWGNHAKGITKNITLQKKIVSQHPMMCYAGPGRTDDFLFGKINHFEETRKLVDWRGRQKDI